MFRNLLVVYFRNNLNHQMYKLYYLLSHLCCLHKNYVYDNGTDMSEVFKISFLYLTLKRQQGSCSFQSSHLLFFTDCAYVLTDFFRNCKRVCTFWTVLFKVWLQWWWIQWTNVSCEDSNVRLKCFLVNEEKNFHLRNFGGRKRYISNICLK